MKVLIVDDEAMICEWLQFCIAQNPACRLTGVAHNGREALELFQQNEADLVLTDIKMPVMDGLELLHALRALSGEGGAAEAFYEPISTLPAAPCARAPRNTC